MLNGLKKRELLYSQIIVWRHALSFLKSVFLFYYEEIMELIDKSSEELIAKNNRKMKMDEYVKKAAREKFIS